MLILGSYHGMVYAISPDEKYEDKYEANKYNDDYDNEEEGR